MKIFILFSLCLRLLMCQSFECLVDFYFINDYPVNTLVQNGVLTIPSIGNGGVDIFTESRQAQVDSFLSTLREEWQGQVVSEQWVDGCFYEFTIADSGPIYPVDTILIGFNDIFVIEAYFFEPVSPNNLQTHKEFEVYIKGKLQNVLNKGEENEKAQNFCNDSVHGSWVLCNSES